jgi:hypothetical protein
MFRVARWFFSSVVKLPFGIRPLSSANIVNSTRIRKPLVVSAL